MPETQLDGTKDTPQTQEAFKPENQERINPITQAIIDQISRLTAEILEQGGTITNQNGKTIFSLEDRVVTATVCGDSISRIESAITTNGRLKRLQTPPLISEPYIRTIEKRAKRSPERIVTPAKILKEWAEYGQSTTYRYERAIITGEEEKTVIVTSEKIEIPDGFTGPTELTQDSIGRIQLQRNYFDTDNQVAIYNLGKCIVIKTTKASTPTTKFAFELYHPVEK